MRTSGGEWSNNCKKRSGCCQAAVVHYLKYCQLCDCAAVQLCSVQLCSSAAVQCLVSDCRTPSDPSCAVQATVHYLKLCQLCSYCKLQCTICSKRHCNRSKCNAMRCLVSDCRTLIHNLRSYLCSTAAVQGIPMQGKCNTINPSVLQYKYKAR